ncbi:MAG: hypothetical protein JNL41_07260 [Phenylobacterium sp.]|nr:hypothetical protein [Phenylobacterium sp.]
MRVRPWATFTIDLPHDQIEDGAQIVRFGGQSAAKVIADLLIGCGCEVSEPIYAHENGWELDIIAGEQRRRLWCQITLIDKYTMVLEQNSWIASAFGRHHQAYLDVLLRLGIALAEDARFHGVRWYTSDELRTQASGASLPVES